MHFLDYSSNLFLITVLVVVLLYLMVFYILFHRREQRKKFMKEFIYTTFIYCTTNINLGKEWDIVNPNNKFEYNSDTNDYRINKTKNTNYKYEEYFAAVLKIFHTFNTLSVGIQSGGLDCDTVYWLLGQDMQLFFKTYKYELAKIRNATNNPYLYINYEMLMTEWEDMIVEKRLRKLNEKTRYLS